MGMSAGARYSVLVITTTRGRCVLALAAPRDDIDYDIRIDASVSLIYQ